MKAKGKSGLQDAGKDAGKGAAWEDPALSVGEGMAVGSAAPVAAGVGRTTGTAQKKGRNGGRNLFESEPWWHVAILQTVQREIRAKCLGKCAHQKAAGALNWPHPYSLSAASHVICPQPHPQLPPAWPAACETPPAPTGVSPAAAFAVRECRQKT